MILILLIVFSLLFVFKLKILKFEKVNNVRNLWTIYFTTIIAELTSLWFVTKYCTEYIGFPLQTDLLFILLILSVFLECIVLLIMGIVANVKQNKFIKENNIEVIKDRFVLFKIIISIIGVWGILFICLSLPKIFKSDVEKYAEQLTLEYMNKKYGDGNFKIYNIQKYYDNEDNMLFGREEHVGFIVDLKTDYVSDIIKVELSGTTKYELFVSDDNLFYKYHNISGYDFYQYVDEEIDKMFEENFKERFNINANVDWVSFKIPDDYGKIPTIEEYIDLHKIDPESIRISIRDEVDYENMLDYLKELAQFSIIYFKEDVDININYTFKVVYNDDASKGYIKIYNNEVIIKVNGEEINFPKIEIINLNK